jgi:hypothetical protein
LVLVFGDVMDVRGGVLIDGRGRSFADGRGLVR